MSFSPRQHWPALAAVLLLTLLVAYPLVASMLYTGGHLIYPLDDTYIHMALAKNLAQHGVWGVSGEGFASASSSLLWPLLLAPTFVVLGVQFWVPLLWSLLFGIGSVILADRILFQADLGPRSRFLALALFIYVTPIPILAILGMEHTAHLFFALLLLRLALPRLTTKNPSTSTHWSPWVWFVPVLLVASRYEGFFLLGVVALLFALRRRFKEASVMMVLGMLPPILHAALSLPRGGGWAPNPLLLKSRVPILKETVIFSSQSWGDRADFLVEFMMRQPVDLIQRTPEILVLVAAVLVITAVLISRRGASNSPSVLLAVVFLGSLYPFAVLGRIMDQYRHEAWLVGLGILAAASGLQSLAERRSREPLPAGDRWARVAICAMLAFFVLEPMLARGGRSLYVADRGSRNIYEQQYQMGRFVQRFYEGEGVVANDIGAINYLSEVRCLDLVGLASNDVMKDRLERFLDRDLLLPEWTESRDLSLAIVYDSWFRDGRSFPESWVPVGRWRLKKNVICGDDTVTFYAIHDTDIELLAQRLRSFDPELPDGVERTGPYLEKAE